MEKASPHIDLWTVMHAFNDHVGVFRAPDPHIVLDDLPWYMKTSLVCEHDLFLGNIRHPLCDWEFPRQMPCVWVRHLFWVPAESAPYRLKTSVFYAKSCAQWRLVVPVCWMHVGLIFWDFVEMIHTLVQRLLYLCLVNRYISVTENFQSP